MNAKPSLVVLPSLEAIRLDNGRVVLQGRFLSGMTAYRKRWPGPLRAFVEPAPASELQTNLDRTLGGDNVEVRPEDLDFQLDVIDYTSPDFPALVAQTDMVLAAVYYRQNHIVDVARSVDVATVYNSEYSLKTRLQIARAQESNPLVIARRIAWEINQERISRAAMARSAGLQANGVPTFDAYQGLTDSPLLYFDGRMTDDMVISNDALERRLQTMLQGGPLRMTWSGRLNKMKGPEELIEIAKHLRAYGTDFTLDIYGGGILEEPMRAAIEKHDLGQCVSIKGFVPFEDLIERTRDNYDLWLCCHPQGDPSGAYLETLGHGLPILGYANEALVGVLARVNAGRAVPIYHAQSLAKLIRDLSRKRRTLAEWSRTAVSFARNHTFDRTFQRRIEHLEGILERRKQAAG